MEREVARDVPSSERKKLAKKGKAMSDGSFPIANKQDLRNAIKAYGRASDKSAAKRHIIKRARALGATDLLPDGWTGKEKAMDSHSATRSRLESAGFIRVRERALVVSSDDTRELLNAALRANFPGKNTWVHVRDFHDDWVIYTLDQNDNYTTWRADYAIKDGAVEIDWSSATEVQQRTTFVEVPRARAFMHETNHSTILTAPAGLVRELANRKAPFLHLQGRFVGAEKANRNGAVWTLEDLQVGEPTVKHGPVNWLHDDKKVIGAITGSELVIPEGEREAASYGAPYTDPFISANSVLWRFLYPQEAAVVEMAAERNSLWYSMECVSESVICSGENGCGAEMGYADALLKTAKACEHVRERASERRFKNPIFLGAGIIVPPVRPGWADANATLLKESASLAERAFEQAGQPEVGDSEWHAMCAQVMQFAEAASQR